MSSFLIVRLLPLLFEKILVFDTVFAKIAGALMFSILGVMVSIEFDHSNKKYEKLNNTAWNDFFDFPQ